MLELYAVNIFGKAIKNGLWLINELFDFIKKIFSFEILQILFEDLKTL